MNKSTSLSVLMPVYNEVYTIEECIKRVFEVKSQYISKIEVIVVDDGSRDGTREILSGLKHRYENLYVIEHEKNMGKGAAIKTAISRASNDICIIQDAYLEYNPDDYHNIIKPFLFENADAVYGSRFLIKDYARVLYYYHALFNKMLTTLTNLVTNINLSDMETCYKAVKTRLLKSIPIRSKGFDFEPEITIKLSKRGAKIYEVPISYSGRTYEEGKKINWRDGYRAILAILKYYFIDDIYLEDDFGMNILLNMRFAPKFSMSMANAIRPYIGQRVLEVGAGLGNITQFLIPRKKYIASDINPHYLDYLENYAASKPYMEAKKIDLGNRADFDRIKDKVDTVVCLNVLEHIENDADAMRNICSVLDKKGRAVVLVPQGEWLFSSLDEAVSHKRRYSKSMIESVMTNAGFKIETTITTFNKIGVLSWIINGKILRRKHLSKIQLKLLNMFIRVFEFINPLLPWDGLSIICIGEKGE